MIITQEAVRHLFSYDPDIPFAIRWKNPPPKSRVDVGAIAGYWHAVRAKSPELYRYTDIGSHRVPVSRVVWIYFNGTPVPRQIRFRNGDRSDCRIENLDPIVKTTLREQRRRWRATFSPEEWSAYMHRNAIRRSYGALAVDWWDAKFAEQNGRCAICDRPETLIKGTTTTRLSLDHCHDRNILRGLLCTSCNNGLGRFRDDAALLRKAADYLDRYATEGVSVIPVRSQRFFNDPERSGITWNNARKRWVVTANKDGFQYALGSFEDRDSAVAARRLFLKGTPVGHPRALRRKARDEAA